MYALYPVFQAVYSSWERLKARGDEFLPFLWCFLFFGFFFDVPDFKHALYKPTLERLAV